jgi:hypothetical protein
VGLGLECRRIGLVVARLGCKIRGSDVGGTGLS